MTIINPFASHLTAAQHSKLAAHYLSRYRLMARRLVLDTTRYSGIYSTGTVIEYRKVEIVDYHTMFLKYCYHKQAAETQREIAAQERTEAGLIALGTQHSATKTVEIPRDENSLMTIKVTLEWVCPCCGKPRGEINRGRAYRGSQFISVDKWLNPCGHVDMYQDVRKEAAVRS